MLAVKDFNEKGEEMNHSDRHTLFGTIKKIEFHNIDKSGRNPKYNVELMVSPARIDPKRDLHTELVRLRLPNRLYWKSLSDVEKQGFVRDESPRTRIKADTYKTFAVGDSVELTVCFSSRDLAHLKSSD